MFFFSTTREPARFTYRKILHSSMQAGHPSMQAGLPILPVRLSRSSERQHITIRSYFLNPTMKTSICCFGPGIFVSAAFSECSFVYIMRLIILFVRRGHFIGLASCFVPGL